MSYAIYEKESTRFVRILRKGYWTDTVFATEAAARAAFTRLSKQKKVNKKTHAIAELDNFYKNIEKKEVRTGIVGSQGKKFTVGVNTSWTSGPWSESYWSN
jgi:hypothetical protein